MKLLPIITALALAVSARAEIGLSDLDSVAPPPPEKPRAAPADPTRPAPRPAPAPTPIPVRQPPRPGSKEGVVRFRNGDMLHGDLVTIDTNGAVEWHMPEAKDPLHFALPNVIQINLPDTGYAITGNSIITLSNGDNIRGDIVKLDADTLVLKTVYAGELKIKRNMLRVLAPRSGNNAILLDGLTSLQGWKQNGNDAWVLRNGILTSQQPGSIGRDLGLPSRCSIEFDMSWSQFPALGICLYASQVDTMPGNGEMSGYWLNFSINTAVLQSMHGGFNQLGQVPVSRFARAGKARVGIYVDKVKKTFTLTLDGHLLKTWTELDDFAGNGTGFMLVAQGGMNQSVQLSNIKIQQWSGQLDDGPVTASKEDVITLANNDRVSGQLKNIQQGVATVISAVAPLSIPVERITEIYLSNENIERARRLGADVQAVFADGGKITFALDVIDDKTITGHSENFGTAKFDRDAFRELQLHIYDEDRIPADAQSSAAPAPVNNGNTIIFQGGGGFQIGNQQFQAAPLQINNGIKMVNPPRPVR